MLYDCFTSNMEQPIVSTPNLEDHIICNQGFLLLPSDDPTIISKAAGIGNDKEDKKDYLVQMKNVKQKTPKLSKPNSVGVGRKDRVHQEKPNRTD